MLAFYCDDATVSQPLEPQLGLLYGSQMALVGTVTRTMGDTIVESQQTAQGNVGAFVARNADGTNIGYFRSPAQAQAAVAAGRGILLTWTKVDMPGSIEQWIGEDRT